MKAPAFQYERPETADEAISLLREYGDEAKVLAGGQSLVPLMALRMAMPEVLIDVNRVADFQRVAFDGATLTLGALTRHRDVENLDILKTACPMISDAVSMIGHVAIRNRGTVLGSLSHADPAAEWPALAVALDATITAASAVAQRDIAAEDFFDSYLSNNLDDDELAVSITVPIPSGRVGSSFVELARRHGDFAISGVGALLSLDAEDRISDARLVALGAASTPLRLRDAEQVLLGNVVSDELIEEAAAQVRAAVNPSGDIHGSSDYRRSVAGVMTRRALKKAIRRLADTQEH